MNKKLQSNLIGKILLLVSIIVFLPQFSIQADNTKWRNVGSATFIDGWILESYAEQYPMKVKLQLDANKPGRFRLVNPYAQINEIAEDLPNFENNFKNSSEYINNGEIIFDISDPDWPIVECAYAGFKNPNKRYTGGMPPDEEVACSEPLGIALANLHDLQIAKMMFQYFGSKCVWNEETRTLEILNPIVSNILGNYTKSNSSAAKIILPEEFEEPEPSKWIINSEFDILDFVISFDDDENPEPIPLKAKYNKNTKSYEFKNILPEATLTCTLKEDLNSLDGFKVSEVKALTEGASDITPESAKTFKIVQTDYVGDFEFQVVYDATNPLIVYRTKSSGITPDFSNANIKITTQNTSATASIPFYSLGMPEGVVYQLEYWGDAANDTEEGANDKKTISVNDIADVAIPISGLKEEKTYKFFAKLNAYNSNAQETQAIDLDSEIPIASSSVVELNFKTGKSFNIGDVKASDYKWSDTSQIPENLYSFLGFIYYEPSQDGFISVTATGGPGDIPARILRNGVNKNGNLELNMIFSYLFTLYDRPHFILQKSSPSLNESSDKRGRALYIPKDGSAREIDPVNGKRYELALYAKSDPGYDFEYKDDEDFSYFIIGDDSDHRIAPENGYTVVNKMRYNVLVKLEFDPSDTNYETPLFVTFNYEEEPVNDGKPTFIGSLAQTSKEYQTKMVSSDPDNYGGWNTYVPFESTNGGYPYTYTFTPNEGDTEYDFAVFMDVPAPEGTPDQGEALYLESKEMYPYLSFWSDTYEWTTSLAYIYGEENSNPIYDNPLYQLPDIKHDLGVTKPFPGHYGASYNGANSKYPSANAIHLTGLQPGHVYRLTLEDPYVVNWNNSYAGQTEEDASRYHVADALSFISLMEYEPTVKSYQLVEDTKNSDDSGKTYYTFDLEKYLDNDGKVESPTYRLKMNDNKEILSCEEIKDALFDEKSAYIPSEYKFTDMLFVRTYDPDWMSQSEMRDVRVVNIAGDFIHNENETTPYTAKIFKAPKTVERKYETSRNDTYLTITDKREGEMEFAYAVVAMKDKNLPLDLQKFTLKEGYTYDIASDVNLKYMHQFLKYEYETDENGDYKRDENGKLILKKDSKGNAIYDVVVEAGVSDASDALSADATTIGKEDGLKNQEVVGYGQLGIPEPLSHAPEYTLSTDHVVTPAEGQTIKVRLYADDLKPEDLSYLEMDYALPDLKLHAHDYHVTFPYEDSNVTNDLATVMDTPNVLGSAGDFHFNLYVSGNQNSNVQVDQTYNQNLGFFNADLGEIFDIDQNQGEEATRSLEISVTPSDYKNIYKRWNGGQTARVDLELAAPNLSEIKASQNDMHIYHGIRPNAENLWEEYFSLRGVDIINTLDEIVGRQFALNSSTKGDLMTGDNDNDYTTLYLIEPYETPGRLQLPEYGGDYSANDAALTGDKLLLTKEEIKAMEFDLVVSEGMTQEAWMEKVEQGNSFLINEDDVKATIKPFQIRNVYLFPITNDGLRKEGDAELFSSKKKIALYADESGESTYAYENWHGVTTPVKEMSIDLSALSNRDIVTGMVEIDVESSALARAGYGEVEVLVDGAVVYSADGSVVGHGKGVYSASHGVYIVRKGAQVQKVFVR